jgi:hypothetical protein
MDEKREANIQFCDDYEALFHKCLETLTRWNELRGFDAEFESTGMRADAEMRRAEQRYVAAFSALRAHARNCVLCEETLRVHVNGGAAAAPASRIS